MYIIGGDKGEMERQVSLGWQGDQALWDHQATWGGGVYLGSAVIGGGRDPLAREAGKARKAIRANVVGRARLGRRVTSYVVPASAGRSTAFYRCGCMYVLLSLIAVLVQMYTC